MPTIDELEAQLQSQREQLAELEAEISTLEQEQKAIEADKKPLAARARIDKDAEAAATLKRQNTRLLEIVQECEDLENAGATCSDRIAQTLADIVKAKIRQAAIEGAEIARKRAEAAKEFEKCCQGAAAAAQCLRDTSYAMNMCARKIDTETANKFTSRRLETRLEERLGHFFKPFGCRDLFTTRDTPLDVQLKADVSFFEGEV